MRTTTSILTFCCLIGTAFAASPSNDGCQTPTCHQTMGKQKHLHGPIGVGNCRACHEPRIKGLKGPAHSKGQMVVALPRLSLCVKCHSTMTKDLKHKYVHKPVASVNCGFCHDPHESPNMYLLRKNRATDQKKSFCFWCHKEARGFWGKVKHKPVTDKKCGTCHAAHSSDNKGLLIRSQKALCIGCHKVKWHERKVVHGPVASGMCTACHEPHSGNEGKLLKVPRAKVCVVCHQADAIKKSHAEVQGFSASCLSCHDAHGTNKPHLLKGD